MKKKQLKYITDYMKNNRDISAIYFKTVGSSIEIRRDSLDGAEKTNVMGFAVDEIVENINEE